MSGDSPLLSSAQVSCYLGAADWLIGVVAHPEIGAAWDQSSSLANLSVGGVAAHVVHGALERVIALLELPAPVDLRPVDIPAFYAPNRMDGPEDDDPLFVALRRRSAEQAQQGQVAVVASIAGLEVPAPPTDAVDVCVSVCLELARARVGDVAVLRAFTRAERAEEGALRVL